MSTTVDKRDLAAEISATPGGAGFAAERAAALTALRSLQLPTSKTEEYRFTPITRVLEKAFSTWPSPAAPSTIDNIDSYLIPGVDAYVVVLLNGTVSEKLSRLEDAPFTMSTLSSPVQGEASKVLFKEIDFTRDALAAMNAALFTDAVVLTFKAGTSLPKPLLILHISDSSETSISSHVRIAAVLEEGASVTLIERSVTAGTSPAFTTSAAEILVMDKAKLDYYKIQDDQNNAVLIDQTAIRQLQSSRINTFTLTLDGNLVRNNLSITIDGEGCESHFHGLYLLKGDTIGDNHTVVDHRKPNSFSNELYKGVMDGSSKGVFNGKIYVRPQAQKTNAFQSNRNILLTDKSTINTKPQLEIWADDVKCSHGCTTGQLDEEALFYLQSRGIAKDKAKAMLLYAFAAETFEIVSDAGLKQYIDKLISERLNKNF